MFERIEINVEIWKTLDQKIVGLKTVKDQDNHNLVKIYLNLIRMEINWLKICDAIYKKFINLSHNKHDDLVLLQSIKKSKYFEQYLAIWADAIILSSKNGD